MLQTRRTILLAALFTSVLPLAFADVKESETPLEPDPAHPAVGEWIGGVSWNAPIVQYGWRINPDGTFSSGRLGRGDNGGGEWGMRGAHLSLKYTDGFRYEGELHGNAYEGTAYYANGRVSGGFAMRRAGKS